MVSSWSTRKSNRRQEASSEPVQMASPLGKRLQIQVGGEDEGQDSDLGTRPLSCPLPAPRPVPSASLAPAPSLLWPASRSQAPYTLLSTVLCPAGDNMGLRVGGQRAHGHTVRRVEAVPDHQHLQALDQRVSTGPSIQAYPESHPQESVS